MSFISCDTCGGIIRSPGVPLGYAGRDCDCLEPHKVQRPTYQDTGPFTMSRYLTKDSLYKAMIERIEQLEIERDGLKDWASQIEDKLSLAQHERDEARAEAEAKQQHILKLVDSLNHQYRIKDEAQKQWESNKARIVELEAALKEIKSEVGTSTKAWLIAHKALSAQGEREGK